MVARHQRHAGVGHARLGGGLVAHGGDGRGGRADEDDAGLVEGLDEGAVLGEEAVAGVDGAGAAAPRGLDHGLDLEVALAGRGRAEADGLVGLADVAGVGVGVGVDGDGAQAHGTRRAHHAAGNLAAVGDQQGVEGIEAHERRSVAVVSLVFPAGPWVQAGRRFSKKLARPSWPSWLTRSSLITRQV